jgi:hypothetical protein
MDRMEFIKTVGGTMGALMLGLTKFLERGRNDSK